MALFPFIELKYIGIPILIIMLPTTVGVTFWRFRNQAPTQAYAIAVGVVWTFIAFSLDYVILVRGFDAVAYYDADIAVYYLSTLLIPPATALVVARRGAARPNASMEPGSQGRNQDQG